MRRIFRFSHKGDDALRLTTPLEVAVERDHTPYQWGTEDWTPEKIKRENRRHHTIGWLQVIVTIIVLALAFIGLHAFFSQVHAESESCFPSYWKMDPYWTKQVQSHLVDLGYNISIDGKFGPKTAQAVKEFQLDHGFTPSGVVDDVLAVELGIPNYEPGLTLYYMADLAKIANESEQLLMKKKFFGYIALGGRSGICHLGVWEKETHGEWKLIASEDCRLYEQNKSNLVPLGETRSNYEQSLRQWISEEGNTYTYYDLIGLEGADIAICSYPRVHGEEEKRVCLDYIHTDSELVDWMCTYMPIGTTFVIDDRAWQPSDFLPY